MGDRRRRAATPRLEPMEGRQLLSGIIAAIASQTPTPSLGALLDVQAMGSTGTGSSGGSTSPSPLFGQGQPTPAELTRERFTAAFQGPLTVGPGRFSDQSKIFYMRGLGGSNMFLHGDYQMGIVIPTNPTEPLTGEAILQDKNNNSGGILGLVLHGVPGGFDRHGRPTEMTFTSDPNIYSGIYFVSTSSGTVTIHYSKNSAQAIFKGLVYTSGLTSPLRNTDLYSRGGRITPRS